MIWMAALLWATLAPAQVGQLCAPCHSEYVDDVKAHKHGSKGLSCEVCHGASQQHRNAVGATAPDKVAAPDEVPALCGACHVAQGKVYAGSTHGKLVAARGKVKAPNCGVCHGVHAARNAVGMARQCERCHATLPAACKKQTNDASSKLVCATCHEPHALTRVAATAGR